MKSATLARTPSIANSVARRGRVNRPKVTTCVSRLVPLAFVLLALSVVPVKSHAECAPRVNAEPGWIDGFVGSYCGRSAAECIDTQISGFPPGSAYGGCQVDYWEVRLEGIDFWYAALHYVCPPNPLDGTIRRGVGVSRTYYKRSIYSCPLNYHVAYFDQPACALNDPSNSVCPDPDMASGTPKDCGAGNPIDIATGNKFQEEVDYWGGRNFSVRVSAVLQLSLLGSCGSRK